VYARRCVREIGGGWGFCCEDAHARGRELENWIRMDRWQDSTSLVKIPFASMFYHRQSILRVMMNCLVTTGEI